MTCLSSWAASTPTVDSAATELSKFDFKFSISAAVVEVSCEVGIRTSILSCSQFPRKVEKLRLYTASAISIRNDSENSNAEGNYFIHYKMKRGVLALHI